MKPDICGEFQGELEGLAAQGLGRSVGFRAHRTREFDFTSNDYLGLSTHPHVVAASTRAAREYGTGARASRLLAGGSPWEERAEKQLAEWLHSDAALLFPTGYQANLGLVTTLARSGDAIFSDALIHASMIDACKLSKASRHIFDHNDLGQLEALLKANAGAPRRLVLVESIYSMDGDSAPIEALNDLCSRFDAWLVVDEAHAVGVCGNDGKGLACPTAAQPLERVIARVVTGGKALGCSGGFVVCSAQLRELMVHRARSFIFTTGISPAAAAGLDAAIGVARQAQRARARLHHGKQELSRALGRTTPAGPILSFVIGENAAATDLAAELRAEGFEVRAVRPPSVPEGTARLRIVLHAFNSSASVARLAQRLLGNREDPFPAPPIEAPQPFVIVGTDTDIGKTICSALVVRGLAVDGPVTYWKPVQTGDDSDTQTVRRLAHSEQISFAEPVYEFPLPASPHEAAAAAEACIDFEKLLNAYETRRSAAAPGQLLIELAGGLLVPLDDVHTQADWLARVRPRILLVARSGLGTLNHTLLTLEALRARNLEPEVLFLVGKTHPSNRETLRSQGGIEHIIEIPLFAELTAANVTHWILHNPLNLL